jgi:hypothetical protein
MLLLIEGSGRTPLPRPAAGTGSAEIVMLMAFTVLSVRRV